MEQLGREFGREGEAGDFIRKELDEVAPRLEWSVPHAFLNRRFAFAGDPHYGLGFAEQIEELGGEIAEMILMGGPHHLTEAQWNGGVSLGEIVSVAPTRNRVKAGICGSCRLKDGCGGVFERYAAEFGLEELESVPC